MFSLITVLFIPHVPLLLGGPSSVNLLTWFRPGFAAAEWP
jgi:hypothetical protein